MPSFVLQAQKRDYPDVIQSLTATELPFFYARSMWDGARYFFHYDEIPQLDSSICDDWQQTIAGEPTLFEHRQHSIALRQFKATNGDYI